MTPREPDRFEAKALELMDPAGDCSIRSVAAALRQAADEALERAARGCESMVIGGRAWTEEQAIAAKALFAAAEGIRALASPAAAPATEDGQAGDEWVCAECGRGFSSKEAMLNHHANWHAPLPVHRCPKCGRQWSRPTRCGDCDVNSEQDAPPSEPVAPANEVRVLVEPCEVGGHYRNDRGTTFHPSPCTAPVKEEG